MANLYWRSLNHLFFLCLLSFFLTLPTVLGANLVWAKETPRAIQLSKTQRANLAKGELIVETKRGDVNRGMVIGVVKAPIEEVWEIVKDCGKYGDWRESLKDTAMVRKNNQIICKGVAILPFPARNRHAHFDINNTQRSLGNVDSYISTYDYIEGSGNVVVFYGFWILQRFNNNHTLVKHVINADLGGWLPDFLVSWATGRVLPDTIIGLRTRHTQLYRK